LRYRLLHPPIFRTRSQIRWHRRYLVALRLLVRCPFLFAGWQLAQFLLPEQPECIQPQVLRRPALLSLLTLALQALHPVTLLRQAVLLLLPVPALRRLQAHYFLVRLVRLVRCLFLFAGWRLVQFLLPEQPECIQPQVLRRPAQLEFPPVVVLLPHLLLGFHRLAFAALRYLAAQPVALALLQPLRQTVQRGYLLPR